MKSHNFLIDPSANRFSSKLNLRSQEFRGAAISSPTISGQLCFLCWPGPGLGDSRTRNAGNRAHWKPPVYNDTADRVIEGYKETEDQCSSDTESRITLVQFVPTAVDVFCEPRTKVR